MNIERKETYCIELEDEDCDAHEVTMTREQAMTLVTELSQALGLNQASAPVSVPYVLAPPSVAPVISAKGAILTDVYTAQVKVQSGGLHVQVKGKAGLGDDRPYGESFEISASDLPDGFIGKVLAQPDNGNSYNGGNKPYKLARIVAAPDSASFDLGVGSLPAVTITC